MQHIRGDVTNELQTSRQEVQYHKQKAQQHERDGCQVNPIFGSCVHFCAEVATGAGATDSAGGGNGCSCSSGSVVSPFERTLSRTGLVSAFGGEADEDCSVACYE